MYRTEVKRALFLCDTYCWGYVFASSNRSVFAAVVLQIFLSVEIIFFIRR